MRNKFIVNCRRHKLVLGRKTCIMGILNVTPDSFSDGGLFFSRAEAIKRALDLARQGADIIDIGGESTRPGSLGVPAKEQIKRIVPVIGDIFKKINIPISVDTSSAEVAEEALKTGASVINDITGLRGDKKMADVAAKYKAGCVIMHMKGAPRSMQNAPRYKNLMGQIYRWLVCGIDIARRAGVAYDSIVVDPGIGFGKTLKHNLEILKNISFLKRLDRPILIGVSRKSFIGKILDLPVGGRLMGTAAAVTAAIANGAHIIRVHDVKEMLEAARIADAVFAGGWR